MLSFLYVYSDHSILECYNLFSGVELSMRSFFVISSHSLNHIEVENWMVTKGLQNEFGSVDHRKYNFPVSH